MNENNILGVVLAGGKSNRFGKDKSEVKLNDKTLIEHTLEKVKSKIRKIIVIANNKEIKDVITVEDCIKGQLGPLVGVLTSMKWIKKNNLNYNWVMTFPCDTPFFEISIIDKFIEASKTNKSLLYFVKSKKKRHNIFGLWSFKLMETLERDLIENNYRKVEKWANKIGVKTINISYDKIDPFFNINTEKDLAEAERIIKNYKND